MLQKGAPLTWVSAQLGHSRTQVTLDWYSWAIPTEADAFQGLLDSSVERDRRAVGDHSVTTEEPLSPQV